MITIRVVIPTHKRADTITTHKLVSNSVICVSNSQYKIYKKAIPERTQAWLVHPDSVIGLSNKRQWIYDKCKNVFMLDDDIYKFSKMYESTPKAMNCSDPDFVYEAIQYAGNICHLMGKYLFAFSQYPIPNIYNTMKPFRLTGYVTGCAFGMLEGSGLKFNAESVAVEDYWISGLNAYMHRMCFIDTRFNFSQKDTFKGIGGLSEYRNTSTEQKDLNFLKRMFGDAIYDKVGTQQAKSKNQYGRTLRIPF